MQTVRHMTPEGPEDLLLVDGALVWPPGDPSLKTADLPENLPKNSKNPLEEVFSSTLPIVRVESAPCDAEE